MQAIEPQQRRVLLRLATEFESITGRKLTSIAIRAGKESKFFEKIREETASFRADTYDEIVNFFFKNWPDGHEFPSLDDLSHYKQRAKR